MRLVSVFVPMNEMFYWFVLFYLIAEGGLDAAMCLNDTSL